MPWHAFYLSHVFECNFELLFFISSQYLKTLVLLPRKYEQNSTTLDKPFIKNKLKCQNNLFNTASKRKSKFGAGGGISKITDDLSMRNIGMIHNYAFNKIILNVRRQTYISVSEFQCFGGFFLKTILR